MRACLETLRLHGSRAAAWLLAAGFVLFLASGSTPHTTAQQPSEAEATTLPLRDAERAMWRAWAQADHAMTYETARVVLADESLEPAAREIALSVMAAAADEFAGWENLVFDTALLVGDSRVGERVRWERARALYRLGRLEEAEASVAELGFLRAFLAAGPFVNDRGQGFEDELEPERDLDLDAVWKGQEGQAVAFRQLPARPALGTIDLAGMMRPFEESTAYLLSAVWVEEDAAVQIGLGSDHACKVWLAAREGESVALGDPVLESDSDRNPGFDQETAAISLARGWNLLLIKCDQNEGDWRVRLRLSGAAFREASSDEDWRRAFRELAPRAEAPPEVDPPEPLDTPRSRLLGLLHELFLPGRDRLSSWCRRGLSKIQEEFEAAGAEDRAVSREDEAVLGLLLAEASRSASRVAAGREENRRRELLQRVLELDPGAARAAYELARYYSGTFRNPAEADRYARNAADLRPEWVEARIFAARVAQLKGMDQEIRRELAALLDSFPRHPQVLRYAGYYAGLSDAYGDGNELFARAIEADFTDDYSRSLLLGRAVERDDETEARRLAEEALALNPFDVHPRLELTELYLMRDDGQAALREAEAGLGVAPREADLLLAKSEALTRMARRAATAEESERLCGEAETALRDASLAAPGREDLRRRLEILDDEPPRFEALLQENREELDGYIDAALDMPLDPDHPFEIVYTDRITVVRENGTTESYHQDVYRILNDKGRQWLQTLGAPAWSEQDARCVEARLLRADGGIEEGRRSSGAARFPPLQAGDVVHVRFRVSDREPSFFGSYFGDREAFGFYVPVRRKRLVYVLPKTRAFHEYRTGEAPQREEQDLGSHLCWSYEALDMPAVAIEPLSPPLEQILPTVQISTFADWKEFGRWYYSLIRKQLEPTPEMTATVGELTQGLSTEPEKARAIYTWIVTQVRYNADWHFGVHGYKPFSAGAVFARRIGDCKDKAILLCAMCAIAGVKAWPVITNLENFRGREDITLPLVDHFNHAIACIEYADGSRQFVDGTATYNGFEELPAGDAGANVIIVRPDGGERTQIPVPAAERECAHEVLRVSLADGGLLRIEAQWTATGAERSWDLRASCRDETERKRLLEAEWAQWLPGLRATATGAKNLEDINLPPEVSATFEVPDGWREKGGSISLRVALNPGRWTQTAYGSLATRCNDLVLPPPYSRISETRVELPEGMSADTPPDAFSEENAYLRASVSVTVEEGEIVVRREVAFLGGVVPASEYPAFRRILDAFDRAEGASIVLRRKE